MARKNKDKSVHIEIEDGTYEVPSNDEQAAEAAEAVDATDATNAADVADAAETQDTERSRDEMSEEELVEAAKRAGAEAAEEELAQERDLVDLEARAVYAEEKLEEAQAELAEAKDKVLRVQADWENYRRRTAQERLDERARATEALVTNLLPVIDDLERAVEHADVDNDQLKQFAEGVSAVHTKLLSVLEKEGVEVIDPAGETFDPLAHQAVGREENAELFDESVAQVYQKGFAMGGKVIRPAMVSVAFGGPKRPEEEEKTEEA